MSESAHVLDLPLRPAMGDSAWFTEARFGMFIHWGLYALPGRHEWVKQHERLTDEQYQKYFDHFDPDLYDPALWAAAAEGAGMRYFCITTKHHEGFCLWDTDLTDYKAPKTRAGRDLLGPMLRAFRERDMRVGLYHSLIDWHHPDFLVDDLHPLRGRPDREKLNEGRDQQRYARYLLGQVKELLTQYGKIDQIFFDFSYPPAPGEINDHGKPRMGKGHLDWDSRSIVNLVRDLQPHLLLNDRLDLMGEADAWDYATPEQVQPEDWRVIDGQRVLWEACQTFSGSWGYYRDEESWKSVPQLVRMLVDTVSKGGNLLLNVGPTGRGEFDQRALDRLSGMGEWMKRHSRSIYGCTMAPKEFTAPQDCRLTFNPVTNRLYLHAFAWPYPAINLRGFGERVAYAQLLNDASEVRFNKGAEHGQDLITLHLPVKAPDPSVPVIEIFLKE